MTDFTYPTFQQNRDIILQTIRYGYARRGIVANTQPGSDHYIRAETLARRVTIAIANGQLANTARDPLNAQGDDLIALASVYGVTARPASKASGYVTIKGTGTFTIPANFKCSGPTGVKYQTTTPSIGVSTGSRIFVEAVNPGSGADLAVDSKVTWDSGSVGQLNTLAIVSTGGIDGGTDDDTVERVRERLIDALSFPDSGGNWSQVKGWAEGSSAAIERAYVYEGARGPASYDVAIVGYDGDGVLTAAFQTGAKSAIEASMPGHASLNVTSVNNQEVDIVLAAELPLPLVAGGSGGGWYDATPWPDGENVKVTAYNSSTDTATVNATTSPVVGQRIAIWVPDDEEVVELTISSVGGVSGAYTITCEGGIGVDYTDHYISTGAEKITEYIEALIAEYAKLGPGEKTDEPMLLPRALRKPSTSVANPTDLTNVQLSAVITQFSEIGDLSYALRVDTGTASARTSPSLPSTVANPPRRLRVKYLAIRRS